MKPRMLRTACAGLSGLTFRLLVFKFLQQPRQFSTMTCGISKYLFQCPTHQCCTLTQNLLFISEDPTAANQFGINLFDKQLFLKPDWLVIVNQLRCQFVVFEALCLLGLAE